MIIKSKKNALLSVFLIIGILVIASCIISYFKKYHFFLAIILIIVIAFSLIRNFKTKKQNSSNFWLSFIGIFLTLSLGLVVEIWGTQNDYWIYLGLPQNIEIPFWVPFAWGLAYKALYKLEQALLTFFTTFSNKLIFCIILPAIILPVLGETVVIYYGVWRYTWQPQILGMPPLTILLLGIFHCSIFIIMCKICKLLSINDPVYSSFVKT